MDLTQEVGRKKKLARCFKRWESYISVLKKSSNKNDRIFSLAWNIVYWLLESHSSEFFGGGKYGLFEPKSWWKYDIYWLLKSSCFELFGNGKYGLFLRQKLVKRWYYWLLKCYCFEFFGDGKYGIFWGKKLMERWYLLVTDKFLFWAFRWWKIRSFFSQKVDVKVIFTWSFWAFHDILGPGKYGFSSSVSILISW